MMMSTTSSESSYKVKLSQWEALLLESLRSRGWSEHQLLELGALEQLPIDRSDYEWDYSELAALANTQPERYRQAVQQGYQIKYNTIRGLRSWLHITFDIEPEMLLEEGHEAIYVTLTDKQLHHLRHVLSPGWVIRVESAPLYGIEPQYRSMP
ncbi:hypothetical protein L2089_21200 [Paenibacillus hunanensis]|uniref:hypothetical protein n=1 Tax=Paenibacillus hunanensis TaxID=539262 RepID=UPI0020274AF1|nr:hypothetical protein [Paenibacillus hunanensis]MCL9663205.1 hypothetical protein [Paenibacillus hunanensis]